MLISADTITENIANIKVNETLSHNQSETCGLAQTLQVKVKARIIVKVNTDLEDRLVNCQLGTTVLISHVASLKGQH